MLETPLKTEIDDEPEDPDNIFGDGELLNTSAIKQLYQDYEPLLEQYQAPVDKVKYKKPMLPK